MPPTRNQPQLLARSRRLVGSFLAYSRPELFGALILVLAASIFEGAGILLLLPFLEILLERPDALPTMAETSLNLWGIDTQGERIALLVVVFLVIAALRSVCVWRRDLKLRAMALGYVDHWRSQLFEFLTRANWQDVLRIQRVDFEHALHQDVYRIAVITDDTVRAIAGFTLLVTQIALGLAISPTLTLLILIVVCTGALLTSPFLVRAYESGAALTFKGRDSVDVLHSFLSGLKLARVHALEGSYLNNYRQTLAAIREESLSFISQQSILSQSFSLVTAVAACAVAFVGLVTLDLPLAEVAVILIILARISAPTLAILRPLQSLANTLPAFDNLERLVRTVDTLPPQPQCPRAQACVQAHTPASFTFEGVSFQFDGAPSPILRDIDLSVRPGEFIVVTGPSGSGKTTLVDLLVGLLPARHGKVLIDGCPLQGRTLATWRQDLGYVPQDPFLFDDTIRNNLMWDGRKRTDDELWEAMEQSCAAGFVRRLSQGLSTRVGDRGTQLSGGERQRLCLARGILRSSRLLILDEATNALDASTEREVLRRIAALRGSTTILAITHRPDLASGADRIIQLANGKLV